LANEKGAVRCPRPPGYCMHRATSGQ
jgi:hypothetical protein